MMMVMVARGQSLLHGHCHDDGDDGDDDDGDDDDDGNFSFFLNQQCWK